MTLGRSAQPSDWPEAVCQTNGVQLHYTRTGPGKPPVMLLHGLTADGPSWTEIARALAGEYDVIMPDLRGHGKSSAPDFGYSYDDHANDIVGLIAELEISPAFLVGHSMGGLVAAVLASRYPKLVRGLVLADPTFISLQRQREVRDSDVADQHRNLLKQPLEEVIKDLQARHPQRSRLNIELIAKARLATKMAAFDVLTPPNPDYFQLMASIDPPCLLVIGERGVVSADLAARLQQLHAKLRLAQITRAGHGIYFDQPEQFSLIISRFFKALDVNN